MTPSTDRRTILAASAALGLGSLSAGRDPLRGQALFGDVETYSGLGEHRTGGEPDHATSRWLASELGKAGLTTGLVPWRSPQFFLKLSRLTVGGAEIQAFPIWWPRPTGPDPLVRPLASVAGTDSLSGRIAFAVVDGVAGAALNPGNPVRAMIEDAAKRGAAGFVLVIRSPLGEPVALNAQDSLKPWPIAAVLVGGKDEARIVAAATTGTPVALTILGRDVPDAIGYEVVGRIGSGPKEVIVSTPSSGWFHCAGERGPGVAIWLALARIIGKASPQGVRFTFVASSGHELDGVGMHHFLQEMAPPPERVTSWLHLGAGIATYGYDGVRRLDTVSTSRRLMTNDPALMPALEARFAGLPGLKPMLTKTPVGEMSYMAEHGYKCWGIAGASPLHHMPGDLPERATGPDILEPVARAIAGAMGAVAA
jgi:hypothetical protein